MVTDSTYKTCIHTSELHLKHAHLHLTHTPSVVKVPRRLSFGASCDSAPDTSVGTSGADPAYTQHSTAQADEVGIRSRPPRTAKAAHITTAVPVSSTEPGMLKTCNIRMFHRQQAHTPPCHAQNTATEADAHTREPHAYSTRGATGSGTEQGTAGSSTAPPATPRFRALKGQTLTHTTSATRSGRRLRGEQDAAVPDADAFVDSALGESESSQSSFHTDGNSQPPFPSQAPSPVPAATLRHLKGEEGGLRGCGEETTGESGVSELTAERCRAGEASMCGGGGLEEAAGLGVSELIADERVRTGEEQTQGSAETGSPAPMRAHVRGRALTRTRSNLGPRYPVAVVGSVASERVSGMGEVATTGRVTTMVRGNDVESGESEKNTPGNPRLVESRDTPTGGKRATHIPTPPATPTQPTHAHGEVHIPSPALTTTQTNGGRAVTAGEVHTPAPAPTTHTTVIPSEVHTPEGARSTYTTPREVLQTPRKPSTLKRTPAAIAAADGVCMWRVFVFFFFRGEFS